MEVIARFPNLVEAELVVCYLRSNGFTPMDIPTASHFSLAGVDQFYHVHIPSEEADDARKTLLDMGYQNQICNSC